MKEKKQIPPSGRPACRKLSVPPSPSPPWGPTPSHQKLCPGLGLPRSPVRGTVSFPGRASSPRGTVTLSHLRFQPPACPSSTHLAHEPSPSPLMTFLGSATSSGTAIPRGPAQGSPPFWIQAEIGLVRPFKWNLSL